MAAKAWIFRGHSKHTRKLHLHKFLQTFTIQRTTIKLQPKIDKTPTKRAKDTINFKEN